MNLKALQFAGTWLGKSRHLGVPFFTKVKEGYQTLKVIVAASRLLAWAAMSQNFISFTLSKQMAIVKMLGRVLIDEAISLVQEHSDITAWNTR
jgi:hypothetical protein